MSPVTSRADRAAWAPTKYESTERGLRASRDRNEVWAASRLMTDLVASFYAVELPRRASGRLLDLGCGKAPLYGFYRPLVDETTLIDWANSPHENPHLDQIQDLNEPLNLDDERFQIVLLSDVLEHIFRPENLLAEIVRVLAPGGTLLMNVPFFLGIHEEPYDFFRYTRFALERMVTNAGLEIVDLRTLGGWPHVMADLSSKMLSKIPLVGDGLALLVQRLVSAACARGLGLEFSKRTAEWWPLGYTMVARKPTS